MLTYNANLRSLGYAMRKLSSLQIIGLVLSFFWIVGAAYTQYTSIIESATSTSDSLYKICIRDQTQKINEQANSCLEQKAKDFNLYTDNLWTVILATAILPLPFYWLYAFIFLTIFRCFKQGSKAVLDLSSLNKFQKYFAYFCYLWAGLTCLILILSSMVIYAESKVPVKFGAYKKILYLPEYSYIEVEGTWTISTDDKIHYEFFDPINTSLIKCDLKTKKCIESLAQIYMLDTGGFMKATQKEYVVTSWSNNSIIFNNNSTCSISLFTIDLNSESLTGIKKFNNSLPNSDYCKKYEKEADIYYKLEDGFAVRQELIRQATPLPLKLIQSIF
jgi:hypothetical protein